MSNNMSRFRKLRYQKWYKYFNKMDNDEKTSTIQFSKYSL